MHSKNLAENGEEKPLKSYCEDQDNLFKTIRSQGLSNMKRKVRNKNNTSKEKKSGGEKKKPRVNEQAQQRTKEDTRGGLLLTQDLNQQPI